MIRITHYAEDNEAVCGVRFYGDAKRILATNDALAVTCPVCLRMDNGILGRLVEEEQVRLAKLAQRTDERAAHLALKAQVEVGLSWQDAKALAAGGRPLRRGCIKD